MPFSGVSKSYKRHKSTSAANIYNCSQVLLAIRTWATRRFRGQNRRNYSSHEWLEHGTSLWTHFQVCRLLFLRSWFLIFNCVNFWIRFVPVLYTVALYSPSVLYTHDFRPKNREWPIFSTFWGQNFFFHKRVIM